MEKKLVILEEVIDILIEDGYLLGKEEVPITKPRHGPCCTCQECGYPHDECVCYHNYLIKKLKELKKVS